MRSNRLCVAATLLLAVILAAPSSAQSSAPPSDQKRAAQPPSKPAPQARRPAPNTPSAHAVPRPPASKRPPAKPDARTLIYPYYPLTDFDLAFRFPYGLYPYSTYGYPYPPYRYPYPIPGCEPADPESYGAVRLDIPQKDATVFVDSFYVGVVEEFSGDIQHLTLEPGPYHLEIRAPGFETLTFEVNIQAGRTITYRTPMKPVSESR